MTQLTLVGVHTTNRKVRLGKELASGGAGSVHCVDGDPSIVIKLYNAETLKSEGDIYEDKINRMLQHVPSLASSSRGIIQLAWPLALARASSGKFVGFSMPALDFEVTESLECLLSPKLAAQKNLRSDLGARITVAANLAGVVRAIHDRGHQIVDMKPPNLRFYKKDLYVAVLDCDGFQVQLPGRTLPAPQVTADYLAPEYQGKPIVNHESQDRFALAVIIFRLLNFGTHPFTGIAKDPNAPTDMEGRISRGMYAYAMTPHRMLTPVPVSVHECFTDELRRLFDRAFGSLVDRRPSSGEWADTLRKYAQKSNALLSRCNANHLWFTGEACGECRRESVLRGLPPKMSSIAGSANPSHVHAPIPSALPTVHQPQKQKQKILSSLGSANVGHQLSGVASKISASIGTGVRTFLKIVFLVFVLWPLLIAVLAMYPIGPNGSFFAGFMSILLFGYFLWIMFFPNKVRYFLLSFAVACVVGWFTDDLVKLAKSEVKVSRSQSDHK